MVFTTRIRLAASALFAGAMLALAMSSGEADETAKLKPSSDSKSSCGCDEEANGEKGDRKPVLEHVQSLGPDLSENSLLGGEDMAIVFANIPELEGYYIIRLYVDDDQHLITLVDLRGNEMPIELLGYRTFVNVGKPNANRDDDNNPWFPNTEDCEVECDPEAGWCAQTCIIADTWPDELPDPPSPPE